MHPSELASITDKTVQFLEPHLEHGETLVWSGKPNRAALASSNPFRSIFGRVIFIIGALMIYTALEALEANPRSPGGFLLMFGIILLIFGGDLASKTLINWWTAPDIYYGITDKRAIILRTHPWCRIDSFWARQIAFVLSESHEHNGLGNVIFANEPFGRLRGLRAAVGFWGIKYPATAEAALKHLKEQIAYTNL